MLCTSLGCVVANIFPSSLQCVHGRIYVRVVVVVVVGFVWLWLWLVVGSVVLVVLVGFLVSSDGCGSSAGV